MMENEVSPNLQQTGNMFVPDDVYNWLMELTKFVPLGPDASHAQFLGREAVWDIQKQIQVVYENQRG